MQNALPYRSLDSGSVARGEDSNDDDEDVDETVSYLLHFSSTVAYVARVSKRSKTPSSSSSK